MANGNSTGNVMALTTSGIWMAGRISVPARTVMVSTSEYRPQAVHNTHTDTVTSSCPFKTSSSCSIHIKQRFRDINFSPDGPAKHAKNIHFFHDDNNRRWTLFKTIQKHRLYSMNVPSTYAYYIIINIFAHYVL